MGLGKDFVDEEQIGIETRRTVELIVARLRELLNEKRLRVRFVAGGLVAELEDKPTYPTTSSDS